MAIMECPAGAVDGRCPGAPAPRRNDDELVAQRWEEVEESAQTCCFSTAAGSLAHELTCTSSGRTPAHALAHARALARAHATARTRGPSLPDACVPRARLGARYAVPPSRVEGVRLRVYGGAAVGRLRRAVGADVS